MQVCANFPISYLASTHAMHAHTHWHLETTSQAECIHAPTASWIVQCKQYLDFLCNQEAASDLVLDKMTAHQWHASVQAYICASLKPRVNGSLSDLHVVLQVCTAIKPESAEAVYLMMLDKSPTQEEFIRGQLTNNPYNSTEVGSLMRDVKNFICRELDMEGMYAALH